MSLLKRTPQLSALLLGCGLLPVSSFAQLSFQTHQVLPTTNNTDVLSIAAHGDFNNDGREDLATQQYFTSNRTIAYQLYLSNGNGTYDAPRTLPASVDAIGDFNHDGNLDFASYKTGTLVVYLGNGDGTFQSPRIVSTTTPFSIVAADLNHDGKTDLVAVNNASKTTMQIWISNGDGTFSKGQTLFPLNQQLFRYDSIVTGDFDGDGKPDVALIYSAAGPTTVQVWYGDGAGHLGSPYRINDPNHFSDLYAVAADVNNDGRTDLVASVTSNNPNSVQGPLPELAFFTGNSNRTMSYSMLATLQCPGPVAVADFNGDGLNDLAFGDNFCGNPTQSGTVVVVPGEGSGRFSFTEHVVYSITGIINGVHALRTTTGTKPDLIFSQQTRPNGAQDVYKSFLLSNTSNGAFPRCGFSGFAEGVAICTPGASATSPVKFSIAAAGPTPMRAAAVWLDGKKVAEQLTHAFSNYSFLDASLPLAAGSHAITVYGTGWDGTLQRKSFTLTVAGGTSCSAPTAPGVHVCQPVSGATVASPVAIHAASAVTGKLARMEVWVDGVKKYTETSSTALNTTLSLGAGSHLFSIFAVNTAGTKWEQLVNTTVQ
jgi:hypothetical protein